jgi:Archaeal ATPase.
MSNPYVGPRALRDGETLYGRGDDAARLFHLLLADRIVLLYSPSGAGKTSLLEAQLTKRLREENFHVIYDIRMHREPAREPDTKPAVEANRYILSAILSMEKALNEDQRLPLAQLESMTLPEYVKRVKTLQGRKGTRLALLFDQFEEIFRLDEIDVEAKGDFFMAIGKTLDDRSVYAVFAMREDSIALLDDYCHLIPSQLKARQRLSLLTRKQAVEAIRRPAKEEGVDFEVAEQLAKDLSRVTPMLSDGSTRIEYGPYVEPVQMQVVCFTVWDKPRKKSNVIDDLSGISVDTALADYYAACVAEVALKQKLASERDVRDWFSRSLITPRGIRTQVLLGIDKTEGLANSAIDVLVSKHIVRRERRGDRTWFELAHDRLVNPIRTSNETWNAQYLTPLQNRAATWNSRNQNPQLLLCGRDLVDAILLKETNPGALTPVEGAYIDRSRGALSEIERAAVEWELAGRPPARLLRGAAFQTADRMARSKGDYHLTPEAKALLAESRAARRRTYQIATSIAIFTVGVIVSLLLLHVSREKDRELAAVEGASVVTKHIAGNANPDLRTLREAIIAQGAIEDLVAKSSKEHEVRPEIQYFVKQGDNPKLRSALVELGFKILDEPAVTPEPTNCVWYGNGVTEKDVRLVAYAVIRSGGGLQSVQPKATVGNVVLVGHNQWVAGEDPLGTEEIDQLPLNDLARPRARLITEVGVGTVKSYKPESREGVIVNEGEAIPFSLPPGRPEVHPGGQVKFVLFQNSKRRYVMNVRPPEPGIVGSGETTQTQ